MATVTNPNVQHVRGQLLSSWLTKQMARLSRQFQNIPEDDKEWLSELKQLECEFGFERSEVAISQFIHKVTDFPNIAKLREFIPPLNARSVPDKSCPKCNGTGFEYCRHCDCRKRQLTDTGLDGDADPSCDICGGRGSLVDQDRRKNTRVRKCSCPRLVAA